MSTVKVVVCALKWLLRIFICVWVPMVSAFTQEITARYIPDPSGTSPNKFTNTTPVGGRCAMYGGYLCDSNTYGMAVPIDFNSTGAIVANHPSERQGAMFKVSSQWREVTVYHRESGSQEKVKIKISGIGATYVTPDVRELTGHDNIRRAHSLLWSKRLWSAAPKPCRDSQYLTDTATTFGFFWWTPTDGVCATTATLEIPFFRYQNLNITYELMTPNPLGMSQGVYTGTLNYRIGPGGDFDMGDVMKASDDNLTLNFSLYVDHMLKVELPPGGERVELVPEGGWQAWLQNPARVPKKLFREQTFNISASGPFSMRLICSHVYGDHCGIQNAAPHAVPVIVRVSLPNGLTDGAGLPVVRQNLYRTLTRRFKPAMYVDRKPATLHFEVEHYLNEVFRDHAGSTYSGTITVVWDSDV